MMKKLILLTACALLVLPLTADSTADGTADWPGFRGPDGDGISTETGILTSWPEGGPERLWKVPLGGGFSGLTIVDGRIFTMYGKGDKEWVAALGATTGKEVWAVEVDRERPDRFGDGPCTTPLVEDGMVYAVSALDNLVALSADNGTLAWDRALQKELGARVPTWGISASPIIEGDLLLFNVGGNDSRAIVAFDKRSGEVAWQTESDIPGLLDPDHLRRRRGPPDGVLHRHPDRRGRARRRQDTVGVALEDRLRHQRRHSDLHRPRQALHLLGLRHRRGDAPHHCRRRQGKRRRGVERTQHEEPVQLFGLPLRLRQQVPQVHRRPPPARTSGARVVSGTVPCSVPTAIWWCSARRETWCWSRRPPPPYTEKARSLVTEGKHWTVPTLYGGKLYVRNEKDLYCFQFSA